MAARDLDYMERVQRRWGRGLSCLLFAGIAILFLAAAVWAGVGGSISGTVKDSSGAVIAGVAWMQSLLQHDSATQPLQTALPWALTAILTGAVAFKVGQRMTAKSRWARFMTR